MKNGFWLEDLHSTCGWRMKSMWEKNGKGSRVRIEGAEFGIFQIRANSQGQIGGSNYGLAAAHHWQSGLQIVLEGKSPT
jgi:hypothetical protein